MRYYPADNITLLRTVHGEDVVGQSVIELAPDQTSYVDTHVRPGARYSYRIFSSYQGIHNLGHPVAIWTPSGSEWDCLLIAPDYRCD